MPQPKYTDEVMAALKAQAALNLKDDTPPDPPAGLIRYFVAVEQAEHSGTATPNIVAAVLRGIADQIDPPKEHQHG